MGTSAGKINIVANAGNGHVQANQLRDYMTTELVSASYKKLFDVPAGGSPTVEQGASLWRMPSLDNYHSQADLFAQTVRTTGYYVAMAYDFDVAELAPASVSQFTGSNGDWIGGTWPSAGQPAVNRIDPVASGDADGLINFTTGDDSWEIRSIISEYGWALAAFDGTNTPAATSFRALDDISGNREMRLDSIETSPSATYTFAAPSGPISAHLRLSIEGNLFDVTLTASTPLTHYDISQAITMQVGGMGEALVKNNIGGDSVRIRIPQNRMPVGNYSTTKPQISLLYQDESAFNAGLDFSIYRGQMTSVVTGVSGTLHRLNQIWPNKKARVGGIVFNKTDGSSATIIRFTTTGATYDTMVLDNIPGGWVAGNTYEVYPGPENHAHGIGAFGGVYQACKYPDTFSAPVTIAGGSQQFVLNDLYGEAREHLSVGQTIIMTNNGCSVLTEFSDTTGFELGEEVVNTSSGARGIIRALEPATPGGDLILDIIEGPSSSLDIPFDNGDSVLSAGWGVGSTTITKPPFGSTSFSSLGWFGESSITAIQQVSSTDFRTLITLDLSTANANLRLAPAFMIGSWAKFKYRLRWSSSIGSAVSYSPMPDLFFAKMQPNKDIRRCEVDNLSAENAHNPDYETHNISLSEMVISTSTPGGGGGFTTFPHFVSVTSAGATISSGDKLEEDGDSNRPWVAIERTGTGEEWGAHTNLVINHWICIGPGGVS